jgi:tetratricopeptide (TPR) repeat protein
MGTPERRRQHWPRGPLALETRAQKTSTTGVSVNIPRIVAAASDRTINRLIVRLSLVLVIGTVLLGVLYFFDQFRTPGPSLIDRDIAVAEQAVTENPNLLTARLALAQAYAKNGRFADAITQYDEILTAAPDAAEALLGRGTAAIALDRLDAAAADFQKIVDAAKDGEMANVDPQLETAYFSLGVIALKQGQPEEAVIQLASAIQIKRTDADALNLLGTAFLQAGEPERAIAATRQAIALVPIGWCEPYAQLEAAYAALNQSAGAQYAAGMAALCQNRPDEAKAKLEPLTSGAYAVDALIGLGLVAETQGDRAAAVGAYTRVLEKDPQNFAATTGLQRVGGVTSGSPASQPSGSPTSGG